MGPPPVDILDRLRAALEKIGRDIERQCAEAFAAAQRANTQFVRLPDADKIQELFLAPFPRAIRSWLRAERPEPKTHDGTRARGELKQNAEEIIERCLPSRSLQRLQPVTGTAHEMRTKRRGKKDYDDPESIDVVEIEILRPLEPDEIQLVRILFPDEIANLILPDSPDTVQTPTIYDESHGIVERLMPIEYRHIFRSRLRWLAAQLREALKSEIEGLLIAYSDPMAHDPLYLETEQLLQSILHSAKPVERMSSLLRELGLTQREIARRAGIDPRTFRRWRDSHVVSAGTGSCITQAFANRRKTYPTPDT